MLQMYVSDAPTVKYFWLRHWLRIEIREIVIEKDFIG
jgi:hypothetical protein